MCKQVLPNVGGILNTSRKVYEKSGETNEVEYDSF